MSIHLTLQEWSLLINATMTAPMIGYGFWIHHIVSEQRRLKDTAIEALKSAIVAKEAEISKLKQEAAPNITDAYGKMRAHADTMTAEVTALEKKVQDQKGKEKIMEVLGECSALILSHTILMEKLGQFMGPMETLPSPLELGRFNFGNRRRHIGRNH